MAECKEITKDLTPKELAFCEYYCNLADPETFGNGTKSAERAGYSQPGNAAWKLRKRPDVRAKINEIYVRNMDEQLCGPPAVLNQLRYISDRAMEKSQSAAHLRIAAYCWELIGKSQGMFMEKQVIHINPEEQRELDEKEKAEARRIAEIRLQKVG